jgi:hypothetical protein
MRADLCFDGAMEGATGGMLVCRPPVVAAKRRAGTPRRTPRPLALPRHLPLVRHLKEPNFVALYILYHVARSLRCVAARTISDLLAGLHSLLALPEGDAD